MGYLHERKGGVDEEVFLVVVTPPKGGGVVWNCVKDNVVGKRRSKNKLDYLARVGWGGLRGHKLISTFRASN